MSCKITPFEIFEKIETIEPIRMTVKEYCAVHGKSTSWATKHLRNGNSLPYVIEAFKSPYFNVWVLLVSPEIKLKQPLK
jgi:hypothetical protein